MGWENVFHCERDEFCSRVLKYHFPRSISYGDIKQTDFSVHRGEIDIISGGFPCQPYSGAGKRLGKEDDRHLWPEMLRAIREVAPRFVVGENVRGLLNWNGGVVLDEIYADLEAEGYEVGTFVLPAVGINAPHRRERVWIVAHANSEEREWRSGAGEQEWQEREQRRDGVQRTATRLGEVGNAPHANGYGLEGGLSSDLDKQPSNTGEYDAQYLREGAGSQGIPFEEFPTQSPICGGDDGLPRELDNIAFPKWKRESIKAYGNAIVPQVALQIFKVIHDIA
jgi:DNA (cytosine-5)-methyltransferase 1